MTETAKTKMTELPKAYRPADFEAAIYARWLAADVFAPDGEGSTADPSLPPFTIIQPPPNITGSLHLGHAQRTAVEDLMVRHARMRGHRALFLPGLDHASIAAQFVLDGILAKEGESRQSLGRERYLERMREFVAATREVMLGQQRRVGASADWGRLRYTMDDGSAKAVRVAFERLYRADLAYRTEALVNWCPGCRTSVSDLEVVSTPETGTLWSVRYHLIDPATGEPDPTETITVATTRPETILGDTAVAVHPDDPRYTALVGRTVRIPFVERDVPIIADSVVDPAFGTGAVKITPAHDHDDHETGLRHGLPAPTILADDATITGTGTRYDGHGSLRGPRGDRRRPRGARRPRRGDAARDGHRALPAQRRRHRAAAQDAVVHPDDAARRARARGDPHRPDADPPRAIREDLGALADQHPRLERLAPAVVGPPHPGLVLPGRPRDGLVGGGRAEACAVCGRPATELRQDPDIFDTWFSSGLWPFSTLGWPDDTDDYRTYYPTSVMETGYDIIFFWVARMMMLGLELTGREPFHTVYLSGLIRDPLGQKMSKTKGNVVDPLGVIDESGRRRPPLRADPRRHARQRPAVRGRPSWSTPATSPTSSGTRPATWSGARPVTIPEGAERRIPDVRHLGPAERWFLSRAAATTAAVDQAMAGYAFGEVTRLVYEAIWNEYCDWGLEFAKVRLADDDLAPEEREATWWTLVEVLDTYLRLLHPVMPFVTEALWAALPHRAGDPELLIVARWPGVGERDLAAESQVGSLIDLVSEIRNARASAKLPAADWLETLVYVPVALGPTFEALRPAVERLARARPLRRELTPEALEAATRPGDLTVIVARRRDRGRRPARRDPRERRRARARPPGTRPGRRRGLAGGRARAACERVVHVTRSGRGRRRRAGPRIRACGPGGTTARPPRPLARAGDQLRDAASKVATIGR